MASYYDSIYVYTTHINTHRVKMATGFDLVAISLKCNNNDLLVVRQLLQEALNIAEGSPAYKKASSASCAVDLRR